MKKIILILFFILPINIFAYSSYLIPGGQTIGINVKMEGVMVVGFYKINGSYNKSDLELGDYIIKVDNQTINASNDLINYINNNIPSNINITYKRNNIIKTTKLNIIKDNNIYKTGLYIKDSIKGCGTLSYIDPETNTYGALGHEIVESNTLKTVDIISGNIYENKITGIEKSYPGVAGSKISNINYNNIYGNITKNTIYGIFGSINTTITNNETLEIGEAKVGNAYIQTVIDDKKIEKFNIKIININENSNLKNIKIEISDKDLIDKTGGVIQGMSGSPIIQNNKIVGVLTHVVVDEPIYGYGIFIEKMLKESEK